LTHILFVFREKIGERFVSNECSENMLQNKTYITTSGELQELFFYAAHFTLLCALYIES